MAAQIMQRPIAATVELFRGALCGAEVPGDQITQLLQNSLNAQSSSLGPSTVREPTHPKSSSRTPPAVNAAAPSSPSGPEEFAVAQLAREEELAVAQLAREAVSYADGACRNSSSAGNIQGHPDPGGTCPTGAPESSGVHRQNTGRKEAAGSVSGGATWGQDTKTSSVHTTRRCGVKLSAGNLRKCHRFRNLHLRSCCNSAPQLPSTTSKRARC